MSQSFSRAEGRTEEYSVRRYRPDDRSDFLSLYESVWGRARSEAWFEWRFEENPYGDGVSMVVAEADGELVGAEPCLPFELAAGRKRAAALQPADWIVHPDHRRRGLFTRMTERLLDRDAGGPFELYYNFPTDVLLPGLDSFDWHVVGERQTYYRIERPARLVDAKVEGRLRTLGKAAVPLSQLALRLRHRPPTAPDDVTVERHDEVPAWLFTALYLDGRPTRLHVARDEAFYDWRFENPAWETTAFVARREGTPVGGVVACREAVNGVTCTRIVDVQPMAPDDDRGDVYAALLAAVVEDDATADVFKVAGDVLPPSVLGRCGFRSDARFPLSKLGRRTVHVARPIGNVDVEHWRIGGRDPTNPAHWTLSLAGQDIA